MLGIYVTILCNWLILWQNALYLYFGRSRICLIFKEQEFKSSIGTMQICPRNKQRSADSLKLDSCSTDSYLSGFNETRQILSIKVSIENYGNQFFKSDFQPMLIYLCRVSFLTTLDIYKAYFRGRHIRKYKENICKRWLMPYSLWKKLLRLYTLGFCNQVLLDLIVDEVKNFTAKNLLQVGVLFTCWEPCIIG